MLEEESKIIFNMCRDMRQKNILNVCSSDEFFYKHQQPYIWKNLMGPLKKHNKLVNLDIKNSKGVDIVCDCHDLSVIKDNEFDLVLFCSSLEHILNPKKVLSEIKRVLRKEGLAIFSAPGVYPQHLDPIDTMLRFPTKKVWESFLGEDWTIEDYRETKPVEANPTYKFDKLVFITIVKCRLNSQ